MVKDEPALLDLSKLMLERRGYRVLTASTPGEAIRLAVTALVVGGVYLTNRPR